MPLTLQLVGRDAWQVYAICDHDGRTFLDVLGLDGKEGAKVAATLHKIASRGPTSIPEDRNHLVDKDARLFQLRVDECRIMWFYDEGHVVICCHGYRKKSNKAPPEEIAKGCAAKNTYFAAKQAAQLNFKSDGV